MGPVPLGALALLFADQPVLPRLLVVSKHQPRFGFRESGYRARSWRALRPEEEARSRPGGPGRAGVPCR